MTEMTDLTGKVVLKNWQLCFRKEDGPVNMHNAISAFADFWNKFDEEVLVVSEKCVISGKIAGNDEIFYTPEVESIIRCRHEFDGDVAHDLMRAYTASGEEFFFYSNEHTPEMCSAIGDMIRYHELLKPYQFYIPTK